MQGGAQKRGHDILTRLPCLTFTTWLAAQLSGYKLRMLVTGRQTFRPAPDVLLTGNQPLSGLTGLPN